MRDKPCLTSTDTEKVISACKAEAQKHKWNVSIAVLDEGALPAPTSIAWTARRRSRPRSRSARRAAAAMTKRPSKFFEDRVKERPAFANFPAGILIQGGLPIMHRNECVGAIGVFVARSRTRTSRSRRPA